MSEKEKTALERRIDELCAEVERLRADQAHWELGNCPNCPNVVSLQEALEQNAKLREQTELLVTLLRNDCDIEASWDGLRKFWYIGLTESGCLMRDRACKAEAENAKLREQLADVTESIGRVEERCAKLREYAKLMHDHIKECCDCCDEWYCSNWDEDNECCRFDTMMRVCGIEVG